MKYDFLKHLNKSELAELESIILGKSDKQELLTIINRLTQNNITLIGDFSSNYIPYYDSELEDKCNEALKTLSLNDFFFFATTFSEKGNTKKEGKDFNIFPEELLIKMSDYGINGQLLRKKVEYPWAWFSKFDDCDALSITFDKIDNMFKDNIFTEKYEGTYNMLNYIKNYIYYLLK